MSPDGPGAGRGPRAAHGAGALALALALVLPACVAPPFEPFTFGFERTPSGPPLLEVRSGPQTLLFVADEGVHDLRLRSGRDDARVWLVRWQAETIHYVRLEARGGQGIAVSLPGRPDAGWPQDGPARWSVVDRFSGPQPAALLLRADGSIQHLAPEEVAGYREGEDGV